MSAKTKLNKQSKRLNVHNKVKPLTFPGFGTFQCIVVWSNSFNGVVIFVFVSNENEF